MHHGLDRFRVTLQLVEQFLRLPEVGDRVFGDIPPLAQGRRLQPVADDDVAPVLGTQTGDDVGADEARTAGDHDHAPAHVSSFIFPIVFVVE